MSQSAATRAYPRQELLREPQWLAARLDDTSVRVIDCDPVEVATQRPHIPGAVALPIHPYFRDTDTGVGVATAAQTEAIMSGLGVSNDTTVVCYDSSGGTLAARIWWVLWYYGHENATFLNGGIHAWNQLGLPTETDWQTPPNGNFHATAHEDRIASCETMLPGLHSGDMIPLDVRAIHEWAGTTPNVANQREGHIPGAVHIEWKDFVDWDQATRLKPAEEIRELLEAKGVTRDKRVVPY
ncbi:MAG TPA: rhodanese-like domain-containing protein [Thermomicrobiales bacterium]|nr:rhodanese-like domain-containing protein [Thermomicrobiales bacterium]